MRNKSQNIADLVSIELNLNTRHAELVRQMAIPLYLYRAISQARA
jgi:hypothetical protein